MITVDTDPPETTITSGPSGATNDNTPTFTFASDEEGSTFECRVDAAAFAPCSSPHTTEGLIDGSHTFEVRATDTADNTDLTPASAVFTVDTAVPPPPAPPVGGGTGGPTLPAGCDIAGTEGNDTITGTAADERICGLGGNDVIKGLGGNDVLIGGKGNDRLVGGGGKDRFLGGAGKDFLAMKDRAKEFGDGGKGIDTARINRGDRLKRVEKRR